MGNLRDRAGDIVETGEIIKRFKVSIFGIIGYSKGKNEADLINYLNKYRQYKEQMFQNTRVVNDNLSIAA